MDVTVLVFVLAFVLVLLQLRAVRHGFGTSVHHSLGQRPTQTIWAL